MASKLRLVGENVRHMVDAAVDVATAPGQSRAADNRIGNQQTTSELAAKSLPQSGFSIAGIPGNESESSDVPSHARTDARGDVQTELRDDVRTEVPVARKGKAAARSAFSTLNSAKRLKTSLKFTAAAALIVFLGTQAFNWYRFATTHEETDDATIQGHVNIISPRIAGTVQQVLIDDNQHVEKGQLLATLEPDDYSVRVEQAKAELELAQSQAQVAKVRIHETTATAQAQTTKASGDVSESLASLNTYKAKIIEAQAGLAAAQQQLAQTEATLKKTSMDYKRYAMLEHAGAISTQQLDDAKWSLDVAIAGKKSAEESVKQAQSRLIAAKEAVSQATAHITTSKSEISSAEASGVEIQTAQHQYEAALASIKQVAAKLHDAELQNSYTKIVAPISGTIGRKSVEPGQRLQVGQQILAIIPDEYWVVANFKETQLERMHEGQPVEVKVDAFPHHPFLAHLQSLAPASGSQFALLPPDNATGNFTKIVQRVPVKIVFDSASIKGYESRLAPGMSVLASVQVK